MKTFNTDFLESIIVHEPYPSPRWYYQEPEKPGFFNKLFGSKKPGFYYLLDDTPQTVEEIEEWQDLMVIDKRVYNKAKLVLTFSSGQTKTLYFKTEEEAEHEADYYRKKLTGKRIDF